MDLDKNKKAFGGGNESSPGFLNKADEIVYARGRKSFDDVRAKIMKTNKKAFGILFGIVPAHQGKGVDGGMIMAFKKVMQEEYMRYEEYEMNWIGDFNSKMIRVAEQVTHQIVKRHATYRKLFDETKEFKRYPIMKG